MANDNFQVRERAGLEESRLNQELVDFLKSKTFSYILLAIALVAGAIVVRQQVHRMDRERTAAAFTELEAATTAGTPSPDTLERVAEAYDGVGAVGLTARLAAADAHLRIVRTGLKPGTVPGADGAIAATDLLSAEERASHLEKAAGLYTRVLDEAKTKKFDLAAIEATFGLAAVAESKLDAAGAKSQYEAIIARVKGTPFSAHSIVAERRIAALADLREPTLVSRADLPWLFPPNPVPPPADAGTAPAPAATTPAAVEPASAGPAPAVPVPTEPASLPTQPAPASPSGPSDGPK